MCEGGRWERDKVLRRLKNVKNAEERKKLNREKKASSKNEDETNEKLSLAFYFLNSVFLVAMAGSDNGVCCTYQIEFSLSIRTTNPINS